MNKEIELGDLLAYPERYVLYLSDEQVYFEDREERTGEIHYSDQSPESLLIDLLETLDVSWNRVSVDYKPKRNSVWNRNKRTMSGYLKKLRLVK